MAIFSRQVNLDPNAVKTMDLQEKRECMDEINKRLKQAWNWSAWTTLFIMAFVLVYIMASTVYLLRFRKQLIALDIGIFIAPFLMFIPSFFANMMKYWGIIISMVVYAATAFYFIVTTNYVELWVAVIGIVGAVMDYRLLYCYDIYKILEKEPGYPEFFKLEDNMEAAHEIVKEKEPEKKPLDILTETAILAAKTKAEREKKNTADNSDNKSDNNKL